MMKRFCNDHTTITIAINVANEGSIAGSDVLIESDTLDQSGVVVGNTVEYNVTDLDPVGQTVANDEISIATGTVTNTALISLGGIGLNADEISSGSMLTLIELQVTAENDVTNTVVRAGDININTQSLIIRVLLPVICLVLIQKMLLMMVNLRYWDTTLNIQNELINSGTFLAINANIMSHKITNDGVMYVNNMHYNCQYPKPSWLYDCTE